MSSSNDRFIIKYCKLNNSYCLIDTCKKMPSHWIIPYSYMFHGLEFKDETRAMKYKDYFERLCGFHMELIPDYYPHIELVASIDGSISLQKRFIVIDNISHGGGTCHGLFFLTEKEALEFKEWWHKEILLGWNKIRKELNSV